MYCSIKTSISKVFCVILGFREVDFFGNSPLELAIQLRCDSSIIKLLAELEEVSL